MHEQREFDRLFSCDDRGKGGVQLAARVCKKRIGRGLACGQGRSVASARQVSTFGAVLDMVTDRVSTACLLAILSQLYRPGLIFLALLGLDIASHWLQMYSTFLCGKSNHKDVKDKNSWLLRAYYQHRYFMAFCCVGSEVLYIILFLIHQKQDESLISACVNATKNSFPLSVLFTLALLGWGIKQIVNVIQMKTAADACVIYDTRGKEKQ